MKQSNYAPWTGGIPFKAEQYESMLSAKRAAKFLGISIAEVRQLAAGKKIPHWSFGAGGTDIRFRLVDLERYLLKKAIKGESSGKAS